MFKKVLALMVIFCVGVKARDNYRSLPSYFRGEVKDVRIERLAWREPKFERMLCLEDQGLLKHFVTILPQKIKAQSAHVMEYARTHKAKTMLYGVGSLAAVTLAYKGFKLAYTKAKRYCKNKKWHEINPLLLAGSAMSVFLLGALSFDTAVAVAKNIALRDIAENYYNGKIRVGSSHF